jgi:hypothetical protein
MQDRTSKMRPFRKLLMTGVAVLFLATGAAHAARKRLIGESIAAPTTNAAIQVMLRTITGNRPRLG